MLKKWFVGTHIKADIDKKTLPEFTLNGLQQLSKYYSIQKLRIKKSSSGKLHLEVGLKEHLSDLEIIIIQFMLGSDKYRERFNYIRYLNNGNMKDWNILFDTKLNIPINLR